ncbi:pimeloyl-ACP methyl ester carboxylesterase [Kribbella aluminosa]|uniref:Pimeloyl-ACP methyl ester carboxylesterase n=1 Tax=Kribbella aluminosa TaxID=416017 RepID=A0ABS4UZA4_9ACTN|nr:alpha/beta hydrolase [Kribbella aluminosa]MBP2356983.1 pimeloyl-ACP methyl ester carboxylesterase [Kribbella aluminosa]
MSFQDAYAALLERWGVPVEHFDIAGTHVNVCGPPDAPPAVLLAGHGATAPVWFAVAPLLAERYRVYAPDLPGDAGLSTAPPPRTVTDLMTWLSGVLKGLDEPLLIGHSYGAWIALTYALQARVRKLGLIDPTDCFTGLKPTYVARALPMLLRPSEARYESFIYWETQGLPVDPSWLGLAALGSCQPTARPVKPQHPRSFQDLPQTVVVVADRTKAHDPHKLAQRAASAGAAVVHLPTATHHSLPALHADELIAALGI